MLRPWVSAVWVSGAAAGSESVLPAGRALLVVAFGPVSVGATLHGPASRVREVGVEPGSYLGVQFRAGGTVPFFGGSAAALADRSVPLDELWGASAVRMLERLVCDPDEALGLVEDVLVRRVTGAAVSVGFDRARRALEAGAAVGEVAAACGVDRRVLAAVCRREVGFGPKRYARLARFERALRELRAAAAPPLAVVAARHGYADQAHLTREFVALAGFPPGRVHRVPGPTPLHVLHDERFKTGGRAAAKIGS
mgnify:CR=1 FL=1